jgi:glycosyltransferase involved in cell wall biosynthesis
MRVVYLNPVAELGGAEFSLLDLLAALRQTDDMLELHLITGGPGPLLDRAGQLGVHTHLLPMPAALLGLGDSALALTSRMRATWSVGWLGLRALFAAGRYARVLRRLLRTIAPDVVHSNGMKCHLLTRLVRQRGTPVLWHVRDFLGARPVARRLLRWASGGLDLLLANSQAVAEDARVVLPGAPVEVLYNGIDVVRYAPAPEDSSLLDELAGLPAAPAGTLRVGLPATYARWKGQDVFLQAATRTDAPMRFYVIGGPIYRTAGSQFTEAELRALAGSEPKLAGRVGFIQFQEDLVRVYRALDVVVHASTRPEPFGRTIVEAMACGRAVIAVQAGGAAELFTADHDAVGVPLGDVDALVRAMNRLAGDAGLRARLGENAQHTAVERFNRDRLGPGLLAIYDRLLRAREIGQKPAAGGARLAR